jgi:hypothetical protein
MNIEFGDVLYEEELVCVAMIRGWSSVAEKFSPPLNGQFARGTCMSSRLPDAHAGKTVVVDFILRSARFKVDGIRLRHLCARSCDSVIYDC